MLAREFGIVNGEFSNLRCLMNTLYDIQDNIVDVDAESRNDGD